MTRTRNRHVRTGEAEVFVQRIITTTLLLIAMFTFAFSFSNVWALGLRLGAPGWAAPLVAPAVDLSVVALLLALHQLTGHGVAPRRLRPARVLLAFSGMTTLALNAAEPILRGAYGRAAFDAVGPILLIGWSEVGPALLSLIHEIPSLPRASGRRHAGRAPVRDSGVEQQSAAPRQLGNANGGRTLRGQGLSVKASYEELLERARGIDAQHRADHGRPVAADTLRGRLGVGSAQARRLVADLRTGSSSG